MHCLVRRVGLPGAKKSSRYLNTGADKGQLKLDKRLCGVGGRTLDYLRHLGYGQSVPMSCENTSELHCSATLRSHRNSLPTDSMRLGLSQITCKKTRQIPPDALRLTQTYSAYIPEAVSLRFRQQDSKSVRLSRSHCSISSAQIHSVSISQMLPHTNALKLSLDQTVQSYSDCSESLSLIQLGSMAF